jgi:Tfp pilus assembly protein PilN
MIKVTNFLPDDYQERLLRRRANIVCIAVGGGSLLVIGAVLGVMFLAVAGLAATRCLVDQQYQEASKQIEELNQLESRKTGLMHKVELSTALLERVPRSQLLARLTNYLPPKTSLMSISMKMEDVDVKAPEPEKKTPGADTAPKSDKPNLARMKMCVFRLDGLAPTDMEVAEYLSRLTADRLFRDVDLQFSEEFPLKEGVLMRRFQLCFKLNPDAVKVLEAKADGSLPAASILSGPDKR